MQYQPLFPVENDFGDCANPLNTLMESRATEQQIRESLTGIGNRSAESYHQMLGYVGVLSRNEQFIAERDQLKELWHALPHETLLPQTSLSLLANPNPSVFLPPNVLRSVRCQRFYEAFRLLTNRWVIIGFATWDLPIPQGPLQSVPVALLSRIRGPETRVGYVPQYFDMPSNVNLRDQLRARQRQEGLAAGVNCEFPCTDTSARRRRSGRLEESRYERGFRISLIAVTVLRRYDQLRGATGRLDEALAREFGISPERVKRLRQQFRE